MSQEAAKRPAGVARKKLEDVLAALGTARADPRSEASVRVLREALAGRSPHAAAKAARIAGEGEVGAVVPEMLAAFERYMAAPAADPGCSAKAAIAEALYRIGHDEAGVFLRGIRHVQREPAFGGPVDTAVDLRGACALGLVRMGYRDALLELAELLADREAPARISAARALAYRGGDDAAPLLRLKALVGDREPAVLSECLGALLGVSGDKAIEFVAGFLESADADVAEAAALALGASRLPAAFDVLREWSRRVVGDAPQRAALLAIATLRRDEALDYLLALVRDAPLATAARAVEALGLYRDDEALKARALDAVAARGEPALTQAARRAFG